MPTACGFGVPLLLVDTPFVYGRARPHDVTYVVEQLREVAAAAERVTGRRIEPEALAEATRLARQGTDLWGQCLAANQAVPAPWTGFDQFIHMAPIVALRGTEECNAYYRMLLDELRDRVRRGVGGIREERVRLLWDNLPVWYELRHLATMLAERGFTFVCSTYANAWSEMGGVIDAADPWTSAARAYQHVILNRDLKSKLEDDLTRLHEIISQATPRSIVIANEILTSTTLNDAIFLGKKVMEALDKLDLICVWVTFVEELASYSDKTVSMISMVAPDNPAIRTYKIMRRSAHGLSYATAMAEKYGLTYESLKERIKLEVSSLPCNERPAICKPAIQPSVLVSISASSSCERFKPITPHKNSDISGVDRRRFSSLSSTI